MRPVTRISLRAALLAAVCGPALGAGFAISEQSAAAMGSGGAWCAEQSPSSIFFNPAGLAGLEGQQLEIGLNLIMPSTEFTGTTTTPGYGTREMVSQTFVVPAVHWSRPLANGHTIGFGMFSYLGLGVEWEDDWEGREIIENIGLQTMTFNPTWAWAPSDRLRLGAGLSLTYGIMELSKDSYTGMPMNRYVDAEMDGTGTAFGFNGGAQYDVNDKLSLGLSYRSPMTLSAEGEASFSWDPVDNLSQQALLGSQFPTTDMSVDVDLPGILIAGVSYEHTEALTLRGDFVHSGWSAYEKLVFDFKTETNLLKDQTSPKNYEDTWALRLGGDWRMNPELTLRLGYYYETHAVQTEMVEPSLPDADRNGYTVGLGYRPNERTTWDFYFLMVSLNDRVSEFEVFPGGYQSSIPILGLSWSRGF